MVKPNILIGLYEAVRSIEELESISSHILEDIIIRHVLWSEQENDSSLQIGKLVQVYSSCIAKENTNSLEWNIKAGDAFLQMRQSYLVGYASALQVELKNEAKIAEGFDWPKCIELDAQSFYPRKLVKKIGHALGYYDGRMAVAIATHMAENPILSV